MTVYKEAGVDVLSADKLIKKIVPLCSKTNRPGKMGKIGSFGGMFDLKMCKYKDPILVTSSDGIGTKTILGISENRLDGLGFDLVGMCLNDIICHGAEPLFFLDYFASSKIERSSFINIIKNIAAACKENNCLLIGGETAEMPGVYKNKDFDLAGFCVGAVERKKMLPRMDRIKPGDIVLGQPAIKMLRRGERFHRGIGTVAEASAPEFFRAHDCDWCWNCSAVYAEGHPGRLQQSGAAQTRARGCSRWARCYCRPDIYNARARICVADRRKAMGPMTGSARSPDLKASSWLSRYSGHWPATRG